MLFEKKSDHWIIFGFLRTRKSFRMILDCMQEHVVVTFSMSKPSTIYHPVLKWYFLSSVVKQKQWSMALCMLLSSVCATVRSFTISRKNSWTKAMVCITSFTCDCWWNAGSTSDRHLQTNAHTVFTELDISSSLQVQSYVAFLRFRLKIVTKKSKNWCLS